MKVRIVSQPFMDSLGDLLLANFDKATREKCNCLMISAFAKKAGIVRLMPHIANAAKAGTSIIALVGIDHNGTSREAITLLNDVCTELYVFHSTRPDVTFHPKVYAFRFDGQGVIYIGSCNLTAGGLFTNVEAFIEIVLDLPEDQHRMDEINTLASMLIDQTSKRRSRSKKKT